MPIPLVAILVAVPLIAAFFLFVLLPRLRERDEARRRTRPGSTLPRSRR